MFKNTAIALLLGEISADVSFSTFECGDDCTPSKCSGVSNVACDFPDSTWDAPDLIGQMPCKQCTQSSNSKCSASDINSKYTTSQFHAIYCNDEYLVAWSKGTPAHTTGLSGIPRPPGEGGVSYAEACVVRNEAMQLQIYKFPITQTPGENSYSFATPADIGSFSLNPINNLEVVWNWANSLFQSDTFVMSGAVGMAKNGVPIYPYMNNQGISAWDSCEVDYCNAHAGRGEDYHYHGDPYGSKCAYGSSDYSGVTHPPQIGMSVDGYPIHGRYIDSSGQGIGTDLDGCMGHDHDSLGYHYHAAQVSTTDGSDSWTEYRTGPSVCWHGDISKINNFWDTDQEGVQIAYDVSMTDPKFCPFLKSDYEDTRPCCGSTEFFAESGVTLNTQDGTCASTNGCATASRMFCGGEFIDGAIESKVSMIVLTSAAFVLSYV